MRLFQRTCFFVWTRKFIFHICYVLHFTVFLDFNYVLKFAFSTLSVTCITSSSTRLMFAMARSVSVFYVPHLSFW
jgi:hypothetical protein